MTSSAPPSETIARLRALGLFSGLVSLSVPAYASDFTGMGVFFILLIVIPVLGLLNLACLFIKGRWPFIASAALLTPAWGLTLYTGLIDRHEKFAVANIVSIAVSSLFLILNPFKIWLSFRPRRPSTPSPIDREKAETFLSAFASRDRMGALVGAIPVSITKDECIFEYVVRPEHNNPNDMLHGGALYSVMDSSQGAFVHFDLEERFKAAATGTATIKYLAPVFEGRIRVRTWMKDRDGRKLYVNSSATDESGREVATLEEIWIAIPR